MEKSKKSDDHHFSLSESRIISLNNFNIHTRSSNAVVFLYDCISDAHLLLASYAVGKNIREEKLFSKRYELSSANFGDQSSGFFDDLATKLGGEMDLNFNYEVLSYLTPSQGPNEVFVGVVFYDGKSQDLRLRRQAGKLLCREFELSRSIRITETITSSQKAVQAGGKTQTQIIRDVSDIVKNSLNCEGIEFIAMGVEGSWETVEKNGSARKIEFENVGVNQKTSVRTKYLIEGGENIGEGLLVPIHLPFVNLKDKKYCPLPQFNDQIESKQHPEKMVLFFHKSSQAYLQSIFSETDKRICDRVYFAIQAYLSANEYQEKYNSMMKSLARINDRHLPGRDKMLKEIGKLDRAFSSIGVIKVKRRSQGFSLTRDSFYDTQVVDDDYLDRIEKNYLHNFFATHGEDTPDNVFVGIDLSGGSKRIEFHFSSHLNETNIFVVGCNSQWVSEASLHALLHFFSELHIRYKRDAYLAERADYITQVRHVIVHHISSTQKNLNSIQSTWRAASKDERLWNIMRRDVDFPKFLDQGISNLSKASKILELGRFIVDEIDSSTLNRKGVNIVRIIEDIFKMLVFDREAKRLVLRSKITGIQPTLMNADEQLLQIAMLNLIDNAIKYSAVGQEVFWEIDYLENSYKFQITTIGNPIQDVNKDHLLHTRLRAKQLDHLNQRHGTGWGLPVSFRILLAHSKTCLLDFETIINETSPIKSKNIFYFEMPYKTGKNQQSE